MTPGERYAGAILVRVVAPPPYAFTAGLLIDPQTGVCFFSAPILMRWAVGQHRDKLRKSFARLGWRASIVARPASTTEPSTSPTALPTAPGEYPPA